MSETKTRKYSLSDFFANYFSNFGRLLLVNLMFSVPLAVFVGGIVAYTYFKGEMSWFIVLLIIPLMSPFFAGLTNVCRKLTAYKKFNPIKDYFGGIKSNWLFFLVNSILLYALSVGLMFIVMLRRQSDSGAVVMYMVIMLLSVALFLFMELSALVMSVTLDIGFSDVIKNSMVMVVKGFFNHLKTIFGLMFVAFIVYSVLALINQMIPVLIVSGVLTVTVLPAMIMYIISYNSYQTIEKHIILPYSKEVQMEKQAKLEKEKEDAMTIQELEPLSKGDPDEYILFNGKTVKRKVILQMIEVRKNGNTDQ